ncbi:MAG: PIG-L family deacetylase [Actinobacteria bacterium]|nr:PIG-L family deacetylase [Actinomycetota bacterium]
MRSVLAVGAHPDDIELGCGGALAAHGMAGDAVAMLVLTGGERGPGGVRQRQREQERAAAALGATLLWGGLTDCSVAAGAGTVALVEEAIRRVGADTVYVHAPDDSHQDHRAAAAVTLSAARYHSVVLHYRGPTTARFQPTIYVDIAAHLGRKLQALGCHRSQVEGSALVEPDVVVAAARYFGAEARTGYAEPFAAARFVWRLGADLAEVRATGTGGTAGNGEVWPEADLGRPVGLPADPSFRR